MPTNGVVFDQDCTSYLNDMRRIMDLFLLDAPGFASFAPDENGHTEAKTQIEISGNIIMMLATNAGRSFEQNIVIQPDGTMIPLVDVAPDLSVPFLAGQGYTQKRIAHLCDVSQSTVSNILKVNKEK